MGETEQGRITIQKYHNIFTQWCIDSSGHDMIAYTVDQIQICSFDILNGHFEHLNLKLINKNVCVHVCVRAHSDRNIVSKQYTASIFQVLITQKSLQFIQHLKPLKMSL